jgi:hypothetical protein
MARSGSIPFGIDEFPPKKIPVRKGWCLSGRMWDTPEPVKLQARRFYACGKLGEDATSSNCDLADPLLYSAVAGSNLKKSEASKPCQIIFAKWRNNVRRSLGKPARFAAEPVPWRGARVKEEFLSIVYGRAVERLRGDRTRADVGEAVRHGEHIQAEIEHGQRDLPGWSELRRMAAALACEEGDIGREMVRVLREEFPSGHETPGACGWTRVDLAGVLGISLARFDRALASYSSASDYSGKTTAGRYPHEVVNGFLLYYYRVWAPGERARYKKAEATEPSARDVPEALRFARTRVRGVLRILEEAAKLATKQSKTEKVLLEALPDQGLRLRCPVALLVIPVGAYFRGEIPEVGLRFKATSRQYAELRAGRELAALYRRLAGNPEVDAGRWSFLAQWIEPDNEGS